MRLLSLSKHSPEATTTTALARSSSWPWQAYCHRPKTQSFHGGDDLLCSALNSASLDGKSPEVQEEEEDGYEDREEDDSIETVIRGARSEGRILFEPAGETSSVLAVESDDGLSGEGKDRVHGELAEGVAVCMMESRDPYRDFRASMEEMVEAHALSDKWDSLEGLLRCYLRVNDRTNHAYILRAFVDLLLGSGSRRTRASLTDGSSCGRNCDKNDNNSSSDAGVNVNPSSTTSSSPCSPLSFYTSSCHSSSDSLSMTPCCVSVIHGARETSSSSSSASARQEQQQRLALSMKVVEKHDGAGNDSSSFFHWMYEILSGN